MKAVIWRGGIALLLCGLASPAAENQLTPAEKSSGWKLLFDGRSFKNWRDPLRLRPAGGSWEIEDGCLRTVVKPRIAEDLITKKAYGDFELKFDWKVSPGGNTGLKYRIQQLVFLNPATARQLFEERVEKVLTTPEKRENLQSGERGQEYTVAFEFQLIDDALHPDALKDERHRTGALYSMIPPAKTAAHPAGEWNTGRLVVTGQRVEHWINDVKVLDTLLNDPAAHAGAARRWSKFPKALSLLTNAKPSGPFSLQHHGDPVWFRNLKVREIKPQRP